MNLSKLVSEIKSLRAELGDRKVEKIAEPAKGLRVVAMPEKPTDESIEKAIRKAAKAKYKFESTLASCFTKS